MQLIYIAEESCQFIVIGTWEVTIVKKEKIGVHEKDRNEHLIFTFKKEKYFI